MSELLIDFIILQQILTLSFWHDQLMFKNIYMAYFKGVSAVSRILTYLLIENFKNMEKISV